MFYSVTYTKDQFNDTACLLAFYTKKDRQAYAEQAEMPVAEIDYKEKRQLMREGRRVWLVVREQDKFKLSC